MAGQCSRTGERDGARRRAIDRREPHPRSASRKRDWPRLDFPILEHRPDASLFEIIEDCERRVITDMLEKCGWNQTDAAERFHIPLSP